MIDHSNLQESVGHLEKLCVDMYSGPPQAQNAAIQLLGPLSDPSTAMDYFDLLQLVIQQSRTREAITFAGASLRQIVTDNWNTINRERRLQLRNFLFQWLGEHSNDSQSAYDRVATQAIIRLYIRIVKLMWLVEIPRYQKIIEDVSTFFDHNRWTTGLQIFLELVTDMQLKNSRLSRRGGHAPYNSFELRQCSRSFRDTELYGIFSLAVKGLDSFFTGVTQSDHPEPIIKLFLMVIVSSLTYDFAPLHSEDPTQDHISPPRNWEIARKVETISLFFQAFHQGMAWNNLGIMQTALDALLKMASLRRNFYSTSILEVTLELIGGTSEILNKLSKRGGPWGQQAALNADVFPDGTCYHLFIQLVAKINVGSVLVDLYQNDQFQAWLEQVYLLTLEALKGWETRPELSDFLLNFWAQLSSPMQQIKRDQNTKILHAYIADVSTNFIDSRVDLPVALAKDSCASELIEYVAQTGDDPEALFQFDELKAIVEGQYPAIASHLVNRFDTVREEGTASTIPVPVFTEQMSWIISMFSALLSSVSSSRAVHVSRNLPVSYPLDPIEASRSAIQEANAQFIRRVTALENMFRDNQHLTSEKLQWACLSFWEHVGLTYSASVYEDAVLAFEKVLPYRLEDKPVSMQVQSIILQRVYELLNSDLIVSRKLLLNKALKTLQQTLHKMLKSGGNTGSHKWKERMMSIEPLALMLENHHQLAFIKESLLLGKFRTQFYESLTSVFPKEAQSEEVFNTFLKPHETILNNLWALSNSGEFPEKIVSGSRDDPNSPYRIFIGLNRDLRGICRACSGPSYGLLFEWLINSENPSKHKIVIFAAVVKISTSHEVIIPVLKFFDEFAHNKGSRISFAEHSQNGFFLFKECASIILTMGQALLAPNRVFHDLYLEKYKVIGVLLSIMKKCMTGNYVNFGVLKAVGVNIFDESMDTCVKLCLSVPLQDLVQYTKALKSYYCFLSVITRPAHVEYFLKFSPEVVLTLLRPIQDGLVSFFSIVVTACEEVIENLTEYIFSNKSKNSSSGIVARTFLEALTPFFNELLKTILTLLLSGELSNPWPIAPSVLGLIIINPENFMDLQQEMFAEISDATPEGQTRRENLSNYLTALMASVPPSFDRVSRDSFTSSFYALCKKMREY